MNKVQKYVRLLSYENAMKVVNFCNVGSITYANIVTGGVSISTVDTSWDVIEDYIKYLGVRYEINDEPPHKTTEGIINQLKAEGHIKLKNFQGLGMNINSDKFLLPDHYTPISEPYYKGAGQHSVAELQELCTKFTEYCHQQALIKQKLIQEIKST